jgi:hypothetical protein
VSERGDILSALHVDELNAEAFMLANSRQKTRPQEYMPT